MAGDAGAHETMLAAIPHLRAFAITLTGNVDFADDLVQAALTRGLENLDKFQPGTSMQAWLFTILRNLFYSEHRKRRREVEDPDEATAQKVAVMPTQGARLDFSDTMSALARLNVEQREALLLVAAEGVVRGGRPNLRHQHWHDQKPHQSRLDPSGGDPGTRSRGGSRT